ncbi:MAG: BatA domain-containing protein [Candidatus Cloacimonetes bacterium]|nr:BatA domain-containing protein [Candidatus Cloacimonadota bacterium]MDY0367543.1 BatA domain-containing protein [Candidatus Syntrophosphaera sp.]
MGGLSFLNSGLLLFTAATVLPLLIWLLAKKKPKRVVFPSLRFIKAGQEEEKKRTRLKNILLLIIRMLIILLVTLATTRPLLRSSRLKPSSNHPPTALAILLDTSYSMDYVEDSRSDLDRARDALKKIAALCDPEDRVILVTSEEKWNRLHAQIYAGRPPSELIDRISTTYTPLPLQTMLELAEAKLAETQLANRELYLITDGQKQDYPASPETRLNVINIAPGREPANLSCSNARVLPQLVERSRRQSIEFQLTNHGTQPQDEVLVKVVLGEAKVAEKFVALPARQTVNQSISIDLRQDGWQSGYVEVVDDRLEQDNRSYFSFPFQLAPRVAVITGAQGLPLSLRSLLSVYAGSGGSVDRLDSSQLNLALLDSYQTLVFVGSAPYSPKLRDIVAKLSASGRGALFCLDGNLSAEYRSLLGGIFEVSFGAWQSEPKTIGYVNPQHYTTSLLAGKNIRYNALAEYWKLSGTGGATLLSGAGEIFALAKNNFVLWNFDPGDQRSTFLLDAAFAVFAYRSLEHAGTLMAAGENHLLGDIVNASEVILPSGQNLQLASRTHLLEQPGIHSLLQPDGPAKVIAVNAPRQESEFEPMDYKGLTNIRLLGPDWIKTLFHTRLGHDLWKILLAAALLLVILELILVKSEELRPATAAPNPATGSET